MLPHGLVEQAQAHFQAKDAAHSIVDTGHGNLAALGKLHDVGDAFGIVGVHDHVDTGIDAKCHGLPLVGGNVVALVQIVDIGPVGNQHTVPVQLLLDPSGEEELVGVGGNAVDGGGIHHRGKGAGAEALLERAEELLAEVVLGDDGRGAVFAGDGNAIAHVVLDAHGNVLKVDVVGILSLQGDGLLAGHLRLQIGILAIAFPLAGPAAVAAQVHNRREHPGALGCAGLVGHCVAHLARILAVESGGQVDFLRIEGAVGEVAGAVDHIQAVDAGDADKFHRLFLNLCEHGSRVFTRMSCIVKHVQDGAHLVFADDLVQFCGVQGLVGIVLENKDRQLDHLAGFLLQGHALQHLFHLGFNVLVGRDCR